jgi:hypothetical protein
MKTLTENINQVLVEWDPIGVGKIIAIEEYREYIPIILQSVNDKKTLLNCLSNILVHQMGLDYDSSNILHINDLKQICEKIIQVYNAVEE